jgi:CHAD domain-containing protein
MKASGKHPDAEISHDWRKHVKHHGAHLRLLRDIQPDFLHTAVKKVSLLANHLGERHDIDMLIARLSDPAHRVAKEAEISRFLPVAKKRLAHLDKAAQRLGQRLFDAKASEQQKRWSDWWHDWREG